MRLSFLAPALAAVSVAFAAPVVASQTDEIMSVLRLPEVFSVLSAEGESYGEELDANMLDGAGGAAWTEAVRQIYQPDRLLPQFETALRKAVDASGTDFTPVLDRFRSDLGVQATSLEISARRAMLDPDVEDASRLTLEDLRAEEAPRLALIEEFVSVNNLVEDNVTSGLNANLAFYQGLRDAGAIGPEMGEGDMLAEVWSQEDAIRAETDTWVNAYLTMAYAPLSDDKLRRYTDMTRGAEAQALNRVITEAYNAVFMDVSRQLGRAAGAVLAGQDL
ncbi:MAG: hypothetical protein R3D46_11555 [Defluviimonas denitrificans]